MKILYTPVMIVPSLNDIQKSAILEAAGPGTTLVEAKDRAVQRTEIVDTDILFGLCDLGFGCPELGYVSLRELESVKGRFGLGIERDLHFKARYPLSVYAEAARQAIDRVPGVPVRGTGRGFRPGLLRLPCERDLRGGRRPAGLRVVAVRLGQRHRPGHDRLLGAGLRVFETAHDRLRARLCSRRQRSMRAWSPERRTSGTSQPRYSAGLV